jgi:hypothetical protein
MRAKFVWAIASLGVSLACDDQGGSSVTDSTRELLQPAVVAPLGIASCDAYLARYEQCIQTGYPAATRTQVLAGLKSNRDAWAALHENDPFKKESLARMCESALRAAETELSAYGCNWNGSPGGGGTSSGGASSGGASSGGASSGGASSGGASSGGASSGGASGGGCTVGTALDLGAPGAVNVVARNACVKVQAGYPSWWGTRNMQLQVQSPGSYPAPFTWSNSCNGTSGSNSFTGDWQSRIIGPVSQNCATLISFTGGSSGNVRLVYYAQ